MRDKFKVTVKGTGVNLAQVVGKDIAARVMQLVFGENVSPMPQASHAGLGQTTAPPILSSGSLDAETFMVQRKPRNDMERATCLGYFLEKNEHKLSFTTKDISDLNTRAHQPAFANCAGAVRNATHVGQYMSSAGKKLKHLTPRGKSLVEALPDNQKANDVIKNFKFTKRKKRSKNKHSRRSKNSV